MKRLSLSKPHLLIMTGIPGSGKSFFAEKFSDTFQAPLVNYHYLAEQISDQDTLNSVADYLLAQLMKTGQSIIFEGNTDTRKDRVALARFAREAGYEPLFVWVQTDAPTAKIRASKRAKSATNRVLESADHDRLAKRFTAPSAVEKHIVISGKHTYASQAKVVLTKLSAPRAAISSHVQPPVRDSTTPGRHNITIG